MGIHMEAAKKLEEEEKLITQILAYKEAGLPIPEDLLPKTKEKKPKKAKGEGKKKK